VESVQRANTEGNWYIIPVGVEDPELVFNVMQAWHHWYGDDLTLRDDTEWEENMFMTERNYQMAQEACRYSAFDIWGFLGLDLDFISLMEGERTPSQFAEENRQLVQAALDAFFGH
jgi:hypothetical protein